MAYDPGALDAILAAAAGDDISLEAELGRAFRESARAWVDALAKADGALAWHDAAARLKGVAASFGALALMRAADLAAESQPHDPAALRVVVRALARLER